MPDARLQRTRDTLPEGYQFGDSRQEALSPVGATVTIDGVEYVVGEPIPVRSTPLTRTYDHDFSKWYMDPSPELAKAARQQRTGEHTV